jgi:Flp pilus assembly protein TadG
MKPHTPIVFGARRFRWRYLHRPRNRRVAVRRGGGAVLEAFLVLPILLALAFGAVEFGWYFYVKHTMQGAAREGARAAIVPDADNTKVGTAVQNCLTAAGMQNSGYTVSITSNGAAANVANVQTGNQVTVTVQCLWSQVGTGLRPLGLISTTRTVNNVTTPRYVTGATAMRKE